MKAVATVEPASTDSGSPAPDTIRVSFLPQKIADLPWPHLDGPGPLALLELCPGAPAASAPSPAASTQGWVGRAHPAWAPARRGRPRASRPAAARPGCPGRPPPPSLPPVCTQAGHWRRPVGACSPGASGGEGWPRGAQLREEGRTSSKHPVSCIKPELAIHFLYDIIHVSIPFSQIIPPSSSPPAMHQANGGGFRVKAN